MIRECQILRVFTRDGVGGNHLGVVTDLAGLTTPMMQAFAADLGFSETIFCDVAGEVPVARIFTPSAEILFAGHPLVGLGWALNDFHPGGVDRIRCGIGEVGVSREDGETWVQVSGDQPVELADPWAVGAEEASMVLMPIPYLVARLASPELVGAAVPPSEGLGEVYLWAWEEIGHTVKARFFAPGVGVPGGFGDRQCPGGVGSPSARGGRFGRPAGHPPRRRAEGSLNHQTALGRGVLRDRRDGGTGRGARTRHLSLAGARECRSSDTLDDSSRPVRPLKSRFGGRDDKDDSRRPQTEQHK